jgi:hypothetical protein
MVTTTIATSISVLCIIPKNEYSPPALLLYFRKYLITGLWKYNITPIINCICAMVAVQWRMALSLLVNDFLEK